MAASGCGMCPGGRGPVLSRWRSSPATASRARRGRRWPSPLVVEVRDQYGNLLPKAAITFTVTAGEGQLSSRFTVEHTTTGADGRAELTLTLGPNPGPNSVGVSLGGRELAAFAAEGVGTAVAELEGDYRTWHLPAAATARLGKGAMGESDRALAVSPDGRCLAVSSAIGVWLYEVSTSRALALLPTESPVHSVSFSPGGILASGMNNGRFELWQVDTAERIGTLNHGGWSGLTVVFSPDGTRLASRWRQEIKLWNVATRRLDGTWEVPTEVHWHGAGQSVAFSPDGSTLVSGFQDGTVRLWDMANQSEGVTLEGHSHWVISVSFSPDGRILASGGGRDDRTVRLWDVAGQTEVTTLRGHTREVRSVSFSSPNGATLASGSSDGTVRLWDVVTHEKLATLERHGNAIRSVTFSPDGATLVSGAADGTVLLRDLETGNATAISGHGSFSTMALAPNGTLLASGEVASKVVTLWDTEARTRIATLEGHDSGVSDLTYSSDGALLASGSWDATVKLWNVAHRQLIGTLEGHTRGVTSVAFSDDGRTLASGSFSGAVRLWNVGNLREIGFVQGHKERVTSLTFSDDGRTLASGSSDRTVRLWAAASREEITTLEGHTDWITSVAFSPDRTALASGSRDGTVRLWDVTTKAPIAAFEAGSRIYSVAYSPDGTLLVAGSNRAATIWEIKTREQIATLQGHLSSIHSVGFFRDGTTLATGSSDGTILLWDLQRVQVRPHTLSPVSGLEHQGSAGATLANPFVVLVLDQNGDPVTGANVTFTVTAGGGKLSVTTTTTDESGRAATTLTLGSQPGPNTVVATVEDLDPVTFTATGRAHADFDGDGTVGFSDFLQFAAKFGLSQGDEGYDARFDLDGNGAIGFSDFLIFASAFGRDG